MHAHIYAYIYILVPFLANISTRSVTTYLHNRRRTFAPLISDGIRDKSLLRSLSLSFSFSRAHTRRRRAVFSLYERTSGADPNVKFHYRSIRPAQHGREERLGPQLLRAYTRIFAGFTLRTSRASANTPTHRVRKGCALPPPPRVPHLEVSHSMHPHIISRRTSIRDRGYLSARSLNFRERCARDPG